MNDRSAQRMAMLQEALASGGTLHLRDAAKLCGVSEMTIRRDLSTQPSPISLLGGRLVMASYPGVTPVYDLTEQQSSHYQVKQRLCQRAASSVITAVTDGAVPLTVRSFFTAGRQSLPKNK